MSVFTKCSGPSGEASDPRSQLFSRHHLHELCKKPKVISDKVTRPTIEINSSGAVSVNLGDHLVEFFLGDVVVESTEDVTEVGDVDVSVSLEEKTSYHHYHKERVRS